EQPTAPAAARTARPGSTVNRTLVLAPLDAIEQDDHNIFRSGQSLIFHPSRYETQCRASQSPI
ncbi:hypothetical protein ACQ1ZA_16240, partial [Enterococcus faecalis]|uniref:hypothetical protein n=1 Tax=Enterococcus faecalis TaxID=1351 RepID=UPI003D6A8FA3